MTELELAYENRIAHLRTALMLAESDINMYRKMLGIEDKTKVIQTVLDGDTERSVKMDKLRT